MTKDKIEYFECECGSDEHRLVFKYDIEDEDWPLVTANAFLHHWYPWYKRVWIGIKYVFGYKCKYGHFDEFIMKPEDAERLRGLLDKWLEETNDNKWIQERKNSE